MRLDLNIWNTFFIGLTSYSHQNSCYKFWNTIQFESSMNFKVVETMQEKVNLVGQLVYKNWSSNTRVKMN
jgi:hypothetical protein